eukprot:TRINITY_DN23487_c0_g1_i2.p1 TRINITY_DN23487_c0_g1~~TRINITY_DN23487_c0_g1_i2.p1  ORF type:complete len:298 (-),score=69.36 TRINITY_DN23487_c0_g1_i2:157-1050(-)
MMGRGIAACCANGGSDVVMFDNSATQLEGGVQAANGLVKFLRDANVGTGVPGSISSGRTIGEAVTGCQFVFEAIVEDVAHKNKVFKLIEAEAPADCVLCTNTSSLSVTEIATGLRTPHRFIAAHFIGPAHLVPLVELCPAAQTNSTAVPAAFEYLVGIGKKPIILNKEIQGFIAARLQAALYRECMHLVQLGVASPEAVDGAVTNGFGRRLNQIGPFTVGDFAGVDLIQKTHAVFFPQLGEYQRDVRSDQLVLHGRMGVKNGKGNFDWTPEQIKKVSGQRDAELLRRLKQDSLPSKL